MPTSPGKKRVAPHKSKLPYGQWVFGPHMPGTDHD